MAFGSWLSYLSADWIATLMLSTLLRGRTELKNGLIVFWTPFLLWHLGSPHNITAYSLEDNELWIRHCLGMGFQLGEAVYIYVRFRSNIELNALAIPLFICGVIKYVERIWALRCASLKQLTKLFYARSISKNPESNVVERIEMTRTGLFDLSMKRAFIDASITSEVKFLREAYSSFDVFKPLFADLPFQISPKLHDEMVYLESLTTEEAFNFVEIELGFLYDLLYTKDPIQHRHHCWSLILRSFCFFSLVFVLIAFSALLHKIEHSRVDAVVTYFLLLGALYLEIFSFIMHCRSNLTRLSCAIPRNKLHKLYQQLVRYRLCSIKSGKGIEKMAQLDLIDYCVKGTGRWFALVDTASLLHGFGHAKWKPVDIDLKEFIYHHLEEKRSKYIKKGFKFAYLDKLLGEKGDNVIEDKGFSIEEGEWETESTDFIRRIFVWHIATALVYYDDLHQHRSGASGSFFRIGKSLSDYMMYLVLVRPSMLPIGFGDDSVKKETYLQILRFCAQMTTKTLKVSMKEFVAGLIQLPGDSFKSTEAGALLDGAKFARQLQDLVRDFLVRWDDEEKWRMISEIWMEMMVHAASCCKWEFHAQQLRRGGELLTHVSLLMAHLGLSTQIRRDEILYGRRL